MLLLCDSVWSQAQLRATTSDYKSVTSKYTQREDFMILCVCVTPRPSVTSSLDECLGVSRFLSFAMEHIKLCAFTNGLDEAVEFVTFCLDEANRDVFCPFAMYNFLSPFNDRLSLVELIKGKQKNDGEIDNGRLSKYSSSKNKVMLAFCMACGISVEQVSEWCNRFHGGSSIKMPLAV